jgi:hypothetical protein
MATGFRNLISPHAIQRAVEKSTSEASVQATILGYLRARRIPHTITEAKQSFNQNGQQVCRLAVGWPDITACFEGRFLGIEVKRPVGGRLRYLQAIELEALYKNGALVVIARRVEDVIVLLETRQVSQATKNEITATLSKGPGKGK